MFQPSFSRLATASALLAALGAAAAALAGPLYRIRALELEPTLWLIVAGTAAAALAVVLGLGGLLATRGLRGRRGRGRALAGILLGGVVAAVAGPPIHAAALGPQIHDVSTDLEQPPAFRVLADARQRAGKSAAHPGEAMAQRQAEAYPELASRTYDQSTSELLSAAEGAALSLEWTIARTDMQGALEATSRSRWLAFVHDVVVRIRDEGDERRVDVRAASRTGDRDLGANVELVRSFYTALEAQLAGDAERMISDPDVGYDQRFRQAAQAMRRIP